jgi:hypothetical protein
MAYFQPASNMNDDNNVVNSKRLQKVLLKMSAQISNDSSGTPCSSKDLMNEESVDYKLDGDDIDSDILKVPLLHASTSSSATSSSKRKVSNSTTDVEASKKRPRISYKTNDVFKTTVSSNKHVQAKKVANLLKAAEESMKPTTPYVTMKNVNNIVRSRMQGKSRQIQRTVSGKRRYKQTNKLIEQVNMAKSSVQSSDSDSD